MLNFFEDNIDYLSWLDFIRLLNSAALKQRPCPGWCGLSACLRTERLQVQFPSQGTCLGCGPGPQFWACERQPIDVFLSRWCFWLSPSLLLSKVNKLKILKLKTRKPKTFHLSMDTIKSEKTKQLAWVHGSEWVSLTVPPSALITLITSCVAWAPHSFHLLLLSPWGAHTMTKKDKKSFAHSLAEWKLFDNPATRVLLGCTAKGWGLILLFFDQVLGQRTWSSPLWVLGCTLDIHSVDCASERWGSKILWPDFWSRTTVFLKPVLALEYWFSMSDSESYKVYIEYLKKFLKSYDLGEQRNLTVCPDGVLFEGSNLCCMPVSCYLMSNKEWSG